MIIPTDPPGFTDCIAQVRQQIPKLRTTSDAKIVIDCRQLFTSLNNTVLDFLITSQWYLDEAHRLGYAPTAAQLAASLRTAKAKQFSSNGQYLRFLKQTGQTTADVVFRVRVNFIFAHLEQLEGGAVKVAQIAAEHWKAQTSCAALYAMADCGS